MRIKMCFVITDHDRVAIGRAMGKFRAKATRSEVIQWLSEKQALALANANHALGDGIPAEVPGQEVMPFIAPPAAQKT